MSNFDTLYSLLSNNATDEEIKDFLNTLTQKEYRSIIHYIGSGPYKDRLEDIWNEITCGTSKGKILFVVNDGDSPELQLTNTILNRNNDHFVFIKYDKPFILDRDFITYIKDNNIQGLVLENDYLNQNVAYADKLIISDLQLFFPELAITVIDEFHRYRTYFQRITVAYGDYEDVDKFIEAITLRAKKLVFNYDILKNKNELFHYCFDRINKITAADILIIYFNENLFYDEEITGLTKACKKMLKEDINHKFRANTINFVNKNEIFERSENSAMEDTIKSISKKYTELHAKLLKEIKGQDISVEKTIRALFDAELDHPSIEDHRTLSTLFFFGPSGTGKTFLAEKIAEYLGYDYMLFHMEQYAMKGDEISLIGSDRQWRNSRRGDLPTFIEKCRDNKHIIVFDEIEKADLQLLNSLLSAIGQGVMHDQYSNIDVHLNNSILIFTSNAGRSLFADTSIKFSTITQSVLMDALKQERRSDGTSVFSPEFCSRIMASNVITFDHLSVSDLNNIIKNSQKKAINTLKEKHDLKIKLDNRLSLISIFHVGKTDARVANEYSIKLIKNEIFEMSKFYKDFDIDDVSNINFEVDFNNIDKEIKSYFVRNKKVKIGVIGDKKVVNKFNSNSKDYEIIHIQNEDDLKACLKNNIFEYYIDPFFGGIEEKSLSITDYNSKGIKYLYEIVDNDGDVPVYILENDSIEISDTDKTSLILDGVKRIVNNTNIEGFRRNILQTIEEDYLEQQINTLTQKGFIIDFKTKQNISKDGGTLTITLYDFKKYMAYDIESQNLMLKQADIPDTKFDDVIDCEEAKQELKYYINYLRNPIEFVLSGARVPKGVLLYGPPGTGKTMLARAMAGEADVNFISTTAADLLGQKVGEGEDNIRRLFAKARKYAPTIIFIDEIDAIGKKRSGVANDSVLTALLTEMDGFKQNTKKPVFVLAATNYGIKDRNSEISELDNALIRRFDSNIYVNNPNKEGRQKFIELYLDKKNIKNIKKGTINTLTNCTVGQSLAIIENILELAYRLARRENKEITDDTLLMALDQYQNGEIKQRNPEDMEKTAIHEAGHAFVSYLCGIIPAYITIEARGNYGGYVAREDSNESTRTITDLLNIINVCLAGKAAQEVLLGKEVSLNTGTYLDLRNASDIALDIACSLGVDDKLLTLDVGDILSSPYSAEYMDKANIILNEQNKYVLSIIKQYKKEIKALASLLLEKGHLTKDDLLSFIDNNKNRRK